MPLVRYSPGYGRIVPEGWRASVPSGRTACLMGTTLKAEFTLLLDHDGYWLVEKSIAPEVIAAPEKFRNGVVKTHSKIASCRLALEKAVAMGANELHIYGLGTAAAAKEIRACGIKPFIYHWDASADLTRLRH